MARVLVECSATVSQSSSGSAGTVMLETALQPIRARRAYLGMPAGCKNDFGSRLKADAALDAGKDLNVKIDRSHHAARRALAVSGRRRRRHRLRRRRRVGSVDPALAARTAERAVMRVRRVRRRVGAIAYRARVGDLVRALPLRGGDGLKLREPDAAAALQTTVPVGAAMATAMGSRQVALREATLPGLA